MADSNFSGTIKKSVAAKDYFVEKNGIRFAGAHLLIEFWEANNLKDLSLVEIALRNAAEKAGATVVNISTHLFSSGGVTGFALLEESHISIHTWPERDFAAIDIFMCGDCQPHAAVQPMREAFKPNKVILTEHRRGLFL